MTDKNIQNPTLSEKQLRTIPMILSCPTIVEGCKKARISRDTFYVWLKDEAFKREFDRQNRELIDEAFHSLKLAGSEAVEVLRRLLQAENETVRLRTATAIIESMTKFIELEDIETRLKELERRVKNK